MRLFMSSLLFGFGLSIVGCSDSSEPQTTDLNAIESYVADNPEAVARQAELDAAREAEEEAEESEDD